MAKSTPVNLSRGQHMHLFRPKTGQRITKGSHLKLIRNFKVSIVQIEYRRTEVELIVEGM